MSDRSPAEIRQLVEDVRQQFDGLTKAETKWMAVEDNSYDFASEIPVSLGDPVVIGGGISTQLCEQIIAAITNPRRPNVHIPRSGPQAEKDEDELEAFFAHNFQRMDPRGDIDGGISDGMTRRRFATVLLKVNKRKPPKQGKKEPVEAFKRREEMYNRTYWRWGMELLDPESVAFLAEGVNITVAVIALKKKVIDFIAEFGEQKGEDANSLEIWQEQFPWVKASDGSAYDSDVADAFDGWSTSKTVDYFVVDDGNTIRVLIESTAVSGDRNGRGQYVSAGSKQFRDAVDPYENTLGRPSVVMFNGRHRPHAPIARRFEGLAWPIFRAERDIILTESIIATMGANRRWIEPPGEPTLGSTDTGGDIDFTTKDGKAGVPQTAAEWQDVSNVVVEAWTQILERQYNRLDRITANLQLMVPTPEMVEKSTAASITFGAEAAHKPLSRANRSISTGYQQICEMVAHDIVYGMNKHLVTHGPKDGNDRAVEFTAMGSEATRKALKKGDTFNIAPEKFLPGAFEVRMEIVPASKAQQQADTMLELALLDRPQPLSTPDRVLEAQGEPNVSQRLEELAEQQRWQLLGPFLTNGAMRDALDELAMQEQRDREQVYMLAAPQLLPLPAADGTQQTPREPSYIAPSQPLAPEAGAMA